MSRTWRLNDAPKVGASWTSDIERTIRRGNPHFPMVRLPGHSFYRTLRDKLGWGAYPTGDRGPRS